VINEVYIKGVAIAGIKLCKEILEDFKTQIILMMKESGMEILEMTIYRAKFFIVQDSHVHCRILATGKSRD
jgi:hypothetical protein